MVCTSSRGRGCYCPSRSGTRATSLNRGSCASGSARAQLGKRDSRPPSSARDVQVLQGGIQQSAAQPVLPSPATCGSWDAQQGALALPQASRQEPLMMYPIPRGGHLNIQGSESPMLVKFLVGDVGCMWASSVLHCRTPATPSRTHRGDCLYVERGRSPVSPIRRMCIMCRWGAMLPPRGHARYQMINYTASGGLCQSPATIGKGALSRHARKPQPKYVYCHDTAAILVEGLAVGAWAGLRGRGAASAYMTLFLSIVTSNYLREMVHFRVPLCQAAPHRHGDGVGPDRRAPTGRRRTRRPRPSLSDDSVLVRLFNGSGPPGICSSSPAWRPSGARHWARARRIPHWLTYLAFAIATVHGLLLGSNTQDLGGARRGRVVGLGVAACSC